MSDASCFEPKDGTRVTQKEFYDNMCKFRLELLEHIGSITSTSEKHTDKLIQQMNENTNALVGQINETMRLVNCKTDENAQELKDYKDNDKDWNFKLKLFAIGLTIFLLIIYPIALTYVPKAIANIL